MDFSPVVRNLARVWFAPNEGQIDARTLADIAALVPAETLHMRGVADVALSTGSFSVRPALQSSDGAWLLGIGNTLDLANAKSLEREPVERGDFAHVAGRVFERAVRGRVASRMAFVREGFLPVDAVDGRELGVRLLAPPAPFASDLWEWDWRCVTTIHRRIEEKTFSTNTIVTVRRSNVQILHEDAPRFRLQVDLDINTAQTPDVTYNAGDVAAFFANVAEWHSELESSVAHHLGVADV